MEKAVGQQDLLSGLNPGSSRQLRSAGKGYGGAAADLAGIGGGCLGGPGGKVPRIVKAPGIGGLHHLHTAHRRLRCMHRVARAIQRGALQDTTPAVSRCRACLEMACCRGMTRL